MMAMAGWVLCIVLVSAVVAVLLYVLTPWGD